VALDPDRAVAGSAGKTAFRARWRGAAPVTALGWRSDGAAVAFGTEDGEAGVIDLA